VGFVNRKEELDALRRWWEGRGARLALVWGRRRIGKTALVQRFASGRRAVFHTASRRPVADELRALSEAAAGVLGGRGSPRAAFADWSEAIEALARAARRSPLLVVLDEFPELCAVAPELPSMLRATWDRIASRSKLRLLLCGSAVRAMEAMGEERAPLYGRVDLSLLVHPFRPHEAAAMLPRLAPSARALVWGLVGGVPLYLSWWDQGRSVRQNLLHLTCRPGAPLLTEGQLVLATEGESGELSRQVLHAIGAGRTKHNEIADAVRADPTRTLDRLVELRLVERIAPVTEDPRRTRRRLYRIADNFLALFLGALDRHRVEIERGLGETILPVLLEAIDDHMGPRWEAAFQWHLRRMAAEGRFGPEVVAVGPFWSATEDPAQIDAVVLAGRGREAILAGEAKWAREVDGPAIARELQRKVAALPRARDDLQLAVCAREHVRPNADLLVVTAADVFAP
jgi:AAA+ ATPase superfamily predicted ATPase